MRAPEGPDSPEAVAERSFHLRFGWAALLVFLTLGIGLETLHGLKVGFYLKDANETRRLLWTLAHAHGTLLSLVNLAFALTVGLVATQGRWRRLASRALIGATVLLPAGFFLGGIDVRGGDPGLAVLMVPAGAAALFGGVLATVLALRVPASREARGSEPVPPAGGPATERERRSSEAEPA